MFALCCARGSDCGDRLRGLGRAPSRVDGQCIFVGQINCRQLQADSITVIVEAKQVVISNGQIKQTAVLNPGGDDDRRLLYRAAGC